MRPRSKPRDPIDWVIEELEWRRGMLEEMGPCTDSPEYARWKIRALDEAIERLHWPRFEVSPFL